MNTETETRLNELVSAIRAIATEPETYDGEMWDWLANGSDDDRAAVDLAAEWDVMQQDARNS